MDGCDRFSMVTADFSVPNFLVIFHTRYFSVVAIGEKCPSLGKGESTSATTFNRRERLMLAKARNGFAWISQHDLGR